MIFNSIEFLIFGLLFFVAWPYFKKQNQRRWVFLTFMSFIFYGWWDWRFLFLIIGSGLIDYFCGLAITKYPLKKRLLLIISLIGNLGSLSVFKYSTFFANIADDICQWFNINSHFSTSIPEFAIILPVGISFYTFQSLSYTIDIYRGRLKPTNQIFHFFSYLSMFPQLVAGPIIRARDLLAQLQTDRIASPIQKWNGIKLIAFGLFQKVVLADNLSYFIDSAFEGKGNISGSPYWWTVIIAFAFQIYCDFSGYSLIARGLAKYMGYHFKMNFNHPYLAKNLKMFWERWHISLSTWFRDYVYIPMGGSAKGFYFGIVFMWITMILSGLWHGANYTFIIWGGLHALFLTIERFTKLKKRITNLGFGSLAAMITFIQVCIGWVYFRAYNYHQANDIIAHMFNFSNLSLSFISTYFDNLFYLWIAIIIEICVSLRRKYSSIYTFYKKYNLDIIMVALAIAMSIFMRGEGKQFIYFQF